jgi:anthranilate synthase component 1
MQSDEKTVIESDDPLHVLKGFLGRRLPHGRFKFVGGTVGYISYDAIRYWEKLPTVTANDSNFPDLQMGVFDDGVIFDHRTQQVSYYYRSKDNSSELTGLAKVNPDYGSLSFNSPRTNVSKDRYEGIVQKAKDYIGAGDIFQVVLSKRYDFNVEGSLTKFYLALRELNPSPYMYFLKMGERKIIGTSPEMLVRVHRRNVETFPIAGTRPRTEDPIRNRALAKDLLADPKENAEHLMLVDLARNDLGRVSKFGSVHVPQFMKVHEYSHVQHIVSRVVGTLKEGCDSFDALRAVFPAGTVSGAPKVRAMEIIEESEPTRRGPYAGAIGYFSYDGNSDFAITIRTLLVEGNRGFIQSGAGIVADSVPEKEWFETEHKTAALMKALELSEG